MIFSVDLDIKFLMKKSAPPSGMLLPWRRGEIPDGGVALTQREELKFLAGINHNTPFVFLHDINIMYDINSLQGIALDWSGTLAKREGGRARGKTVGSLDLLVVDLKTFAKSEMYGGWWYSHLIHNMRLRYDSTKTKHKQKQDSWVTWPPCSGFEYLFKVGAFWN